MKTYEFLLIVNPQFSDDELAGVLDGIFDVIKKEGGEIKKHKMLGRQALAYPIKNVKHGIYVIVEIETEPLAIKKINRAFQLTTEILRFDISKDISTKEFSFSKKEENFKERELKLPQKKYKFETETERKNNLEIPESEKRTTDNKEEKIENTKETDKTEVLVQEEKSEKVSMEDLDKKLDEILNEEVL